MITYRYVIDMILLLKRPWLVTVATALIYSSTICLAQPSMNEEIFLSRPGSIPRGYQNDNLQSNEIESNQTGIGMSLDNDATGVIPQINSSGMITPSKCGLKFFDPTQQFGINIRSAIIFSISIFFIGLMLDLSILPPFMRFVPENEIKGYKYTWRLIIILAMMGGFFIPNAINIVIDSGLYNGHPVSSVGRM